MFDEPKKFVNISPNFFFHRYFKVNFFYRPHFLRWNVRALNPTPNWGGRKIEGGYPSPIYFSGKTIPPQFFFSGRTIPPQFFFPGKTDPSIFFQRKDNPFYFYSAKIAISEVKNNEFVSSVNLPQKIFSPAAGHF